MVCYARPAGRFAALLIVALLVFGRPISHFFDTAAFMVVAAVDVSSCGAALTAMPTPRTPAVTATMVRQPRGSPRRLLF